MTTSHVAGRGGLFRPARYGSEMGELTSGEGCVPGKGGKAQRKDDTSHGAVSPWSSRRCCLNSCESSSSRESSVR